jgi:predicted RNA binding protein YcfA (HicA-like mRNA interferase family)
LTRLHPVRAREVIRFLESLGFVQVRQKGSHKFFRHPDGRTATVPDHRGERTWAAASLPRSCAMPKAPRKNFSTGSRVSGFCFPFPIPKTRNPKPYTSPGPETAPIPNPETVVAAAFRRPCVGLKADATLADTHLARQIPRSPNRAGAVIVDGFCRGHGGCGDAGGPARDCGHKRPQARNLPCRAT